MWFDNLPGDLGPQITIFPNDINDTLICRLYRTVNLNNPQQMPKIPLRFKLLEFLIHNPPRRPANNIHLTEDVEFVLIIELLLVYKQVEVGAFD